MEERAQFLEGRLHGRHRFVLHLLHCFARSAGLSIDSQRIGQPISQAKQIHDQAARLLAIDPVDASYRLHKVVRCQRLV